MDKIDLSIVIANYNTKDITLDCLNSIWRHKIDFSYEIILVDDGSTDGSSDFFSKLKGIKFVSNHKNLGYVRSNNLGMKLAKGRNILLLNSDTVLKKDSINNLLSFALESDDAGVVGSKLLNLDGSVQESCYFFPSVINTLMGKNNKFYPNDTRPSEVDGVVGAVFLITEAAIKKIGFLDERYVSYYEDVNYCTKVWQNDLKVYYLPTSEVFHHHGATFKKITNSENQWRKLIPSSIIYNGLIKHYLIFLIMWTQQKIKKLFHFFSVDN